MNGGSGPPSGSWGLQTGPNPTDRAKRGNYKGFQRYACKMANGAGKRTVMGMLAACSILNKVNARSDGRFSDVVLVVCPNVTIRNRLQELTPGLGDASIYRTRDLVPPHLMPSLTHRQERRVALDAVDPRHRGKAELAWRPGRGQHPE